MAIVITEALAKHQRTDDVGHSSAQEECRIKLCSYKKKKKINLKFLVAISNLVAILSSICTLILTLLFKGPLTVAFCVRK